MFRPHYTRGIQKRDSYCVILDLCLRKTQLGKSHNYRYAIVFEKLRFQNVFRPSTRKRKTAVSNPSGLKSVFEKLRFRDGLVLSQANI